jgi:integrating conjugative element relaxase (TIGR03760 family)
LNGSPLRSTSPLRQLYARLLQAVGAAPAAAAAKPAQPSPPQPEQSTQSPRIIQGTQTGWLRVLNAPELLASVQAEKAIDAMWQQSKVADIVWRRDLLPALHRYAEFVQLMPASESHHHAHAGGLLAHTIEMLLAAMTWRNGHFLPENASVEDMDSQRDEWTYVVFFAALLHDIAKPLTDLRIRWRYAGMADPIRWVPLSGSLSQVSAGRRDSEYLVEFTPKSARDYSAHGRVAITLLHQIATSTALTFLARRPHTMDALVQYLGGQDTTSLVASIVKRADKASTQRALKLGNRARFDTATSVPLIELLMTAIRSMLRSGTALPLNRSGAAGWVFEGSVWFVAKRLADTVRGHLKQHAPDDAIPGDAKNDRLFDTWQEYGCIKLNPQSGQAVWYVSVHGTAEDGSEGYEHALTMLQFPLDKLFENPSQYPADMRGRIDIKEKRTTGDDVQGEAKGDVPQPDLHSEIAAASPSTDLQNTAPASMEVGSQRPRGKSSTPAPLKAPTFNKPKAVTPVAPPPSFPSMEQVDVSTVEAPLTQPIPDVEQPAPTSSDHKAAAAPKRMSDSPIASPFGRFNDDHLGGLGFDDFLEDDDDVKVAANAPKTRAQPQGTARPDTDEANLLQLPPAAATLPASDAVPSVARLIRPAPAAAPASSGRTRPALPPTGATTRKATEHQAGPVVLLPEMPQISTNEQVADPSATALTFMAWVQEGLVQRRIKYNETGAAVHFTQEGMALVSPFIFKLFARETGAAEDADERGLQVQREVIKANWHLVGPSKRNIVRYDVLGRGNGPVSKLSAVVLLGADRWVMPVPPPNPVLRLAPLQRQIDKP